MTLTKGVVGDEVFLQGNFLSIGISNVGSIGTTKAAPVGFNTDASKGYYRVGMVADLDGFGVGKAAMNDAVLQGASIEGFNIGYKTGGKTFIQSNQKLDGLQEIQGANSVVTSGNKLQATWAGETTEHLGVTQVITLAEDGKYLKFEVTLTNDSGSAMNDLKYMRTVDPDFGSSFATTNTVVRQGADGALITAAANGSASPLFYYTSDTRAVVTSYGFINEDPYASTVAVAQAVGTTTKSDASININFSLGGLAAGASTTVVFYMGITDNLAATIKQIDGSGTSTPPPPVNTAPVAVDDAASVVTGGNAKGNVLTNDKDANGDALTASLKSGPANGTVTLNADGSYVYKAAAGFTGTDSFTYAASDGKAADVATVNIRVTAAPNSAPVANDDQASTTGTAAATGNVLRNDTDANGDALTASLKSGPANGTLTLNADGSFVYKAAAGFVGTDSFSYAASDGKASDIAVVKIDVKAPPPPTAPGLPDSPLLQRAGTIDGSAATNDVLTGAATHNSFYFDLSKASGDDKITNFGRDDVLVTKGALRDGNNDGIITASKSALALDTAKDGDSVAIAGVSSLRFLGTDDHGLSVYANALTRPKGAIEGKIGDDKLVGDAGDAKKSVFFYDTALDIHLGNDGIANFGAKDLLVTTTKLGTTDLGASGLVKLVGDTGGIGSIEMHGVDGGAITSLELDGSVTKGGVTYYVYSLAGSHVGTTDLVI